MAWETTKTTAGLKDYNACPHEEGLRRNQKAKGSTVLKVSSLIPERGTLIENYIKGSNEKNFLWGGKGSGAP